MNKQKYQIKLINKINRRVLDSITLTEVMAQEAWKFLSVKARLSASCQVKRRIRRVAITSALVCLFALGGTEDKHWGSTTAEAADISLAPASDVAKVSGKER